MCKLYITLFLFFSSVVAWGQEPAMLHLEGWGGSEVDGVSRSIPTYDGGFILPINATSLVGTGNVDTLCSYFAPKQIFRKYNADASTIEWTKCYGNGEDSSLHFMFPKPDGSTVFGGAYWGGGRGSIIQKIDANESVVWERQYSRGNGTFLIDMIETSDGGYVMLGEANHVDTNILVHYGHWMESDIWVMKLDSNGIKQWCVVLGGSEDEQAGKVLEGAGGYLYIGGRTNSTDYDITNNHGWYDAMVAKLDKDGNKIWVKAYGGSTTDIGNSLCMDGNGGLLITGSALSNDGDVSGHISGTNVWVMNIDSSGNVLWNNCFGGAGYEIGRVIARAGDGSIWVGCDLFGGSGGQIAATYNNHDTWLLHIGIAGNFINAKVIGSTSYEAIKAIQPLSDNTVLVGGMFTKANGSFSTLTHYGEHDGFVSRFAPWTTTVPQTQIIPSDISLYPNPLPKNHSLHLNTFAGDKECTIIAYDVTGRQVLSTTAKTGTELDLAPFQLQPGIYFFSIANNTGQRIHSQKIVIE